MQIKTHEKISQTKKTIVNAMNAIKDEEQQKLVLYATLLDKNMHSITKSVLNEIYSSKNWQNQYTKVNENNMTEVSEESFAASTDEILENETTQAFCNNQKHQLAEYILDNLKGLIKELTKQKGRTSNKKERVLRILTTAISGNSMHDKFSASDIGECLGMSAKTAQKRLVQGTKQRNLILSKMGTDEEDESLSFDVKGKREAKITQELREEILKWVNSHDKVRISPNQNDVLKINGIDTEKNCWKFQLQSF